MVALKCHATTGNYTVSYDSVTRQIQLINHSFKKHSILKFEIKSQIILQVQDVLICIVCIIIQRGSVFLVTYC